MTARQQPQPHTAGTTNAWYPKDDLVAIVGDTQTAERTSSALTQVGVAPADIRLWTLPEVEAGFQADQAHRASLERLGADLSPTEIQAAEAYFAALKQGQKVIAVHATQPDQVERAARVLKSRGAQTIRYYGPWSGAGLDSIQSD
jgi:hypothetical protein